jgi:hypothetical protein
MLTAVARRHRGITETCFVLRDRDIRGDAFMRPEVGALVEAWRGWRRADGLAYRASFNPIDFPRLLPNLMLIEKVEPNDFYYRVVGGRIVESIGLDATGKRLSELDDRVNRPALHRTFTEVLADPYAAYAQLMTGVIFQRDWRFYERLLLPLCDEASRAVFILGCTIGERIVGGD